MRKLVALLLALLLLFVGCSSDISQEEHDAAVAEKNASEPEVDALRKEIEENEESPESEIETEQQNNTEQDVSKMTLNEAIEFSTSKNKINLLYVTDLQDYIPEMSGVAIVLEAQDNVSAEYIQMGMLMDIKEIWKILQEIDYKENIAIIFLFPIKDTSGNYESTPILLTVISPEALQKINFSGFSYTSVPNVCEVFDIHASFA